MKKHANTSNLLAQKPVGPATVLASRGSIVATYRVSAITLNQEGVVIATNKPCLKGVATGADFESHTQAEETTQLKVEKFPGHQHHLFAEIVYL